MAAGERDNLDREEIRGFCNKDEVVSCSSSSSSFVKESVKWKADRMVEIELDAARALADFAQMALLESASTSLSWGNKGRRSSSSLSKKKKKRVQNDSSSVSEWGKVKSSPDEVVQDSTVEDNQCHKKMRTSVTTKAVKAEQDLEMPKSTPQCSTSCVSSGGGRPKHQLTEAEKEAKRLRRILANRESARQTIRRRQAMCEELTKKEADLILENENLHREKEKVTKEYLLLKHKNDYLKAEIARTIKTKEEMLSTPVKPVTSSPEKQQPSVVHTRPVVTPLVWSPIIKAQPLIHDTLVPACKIEPSEDPRNQNLQTTNGLGPPFYIMPCPWFFPVGNGLYPHPLDSLCLTNKQDDPCDLKGPDDAETDTKPTTNLPDTTIRLAPGEEACEPAMLHEDSSIKEESGSSSTVNAFPENAHNVYHSKKMVDAAMAAEARKRRKELTRLKNLNGRQLRLQC